MSVDHRERLRSIRTFPALVEYLHDELDWPIESDQFEEITFDYTPEELGINPDVAAKIDEIRQLRPLVTGQPWGIFFVKFEPRRLPVVALRRVLRSLVVRKRQSADRAHIAAWQLHDLLFISAYGEDDERQITFAHFSDDPEFGDLPTLRVLGWDDADTALHLDHVYDTLHEKLAWPEDEEDVDDWREAWSSAFTVRHREVIATSKQLAQRLAELARVIRRRVHAALAVEAEDGPTRALMNAFKEALIHDLTEDDFADMYAQTIAYGLLSARVSRPGGIVADDVKHMVPITNPFLRDLLDTFLDVGGRAGGIDFDELGVNDVVEVLRRANMEAVLRDFGDRNPREDPVIHFYEAFLKEYDAHKRMKRGVFYTPRPVVSFIVRSVHELLRRDFGLEDGLADTTTWGEMIERNDRIELPKGAKPEDPFVRILDPAAGTGTFLVEVIDLIHHTMVEKWRDARFSDDEITDLWNDYVPEHLLPRLLGFELLMAPYAIAHMKIGLKLHETGYRFESDERVRVFLTNTLEPGETRAATMFDDLIAHEAAAAAEIKRDTPITVVLGNPPYSVGSLNTGAWIGGLLDDYKRDLNEKKTCLDDDYIKFIRFAESRISASGSGILGFITNNSYLDGLTHRQMRHRLLTAYDELHILNLHGDIKSKERTPDGEADSNVFDIQQGVAISLMVKFADHRSGTCALYADLWGTREVKYEELIARDAASTPWAQLEPTVPHYFLVPRDLSFESEYRHSPSVRDFFELSKSGIKSDRDPLFYDDSRTALWDRMETLFRRPIPDSFVEEFRVVASSSYDLPSRVTRATLCESNVSRCLYRPFDEQWLYYDRGLTSRPAYEVMQHMQKANRALLLMRQVVWEGDYSHFFCTNGLVDVRAFISSRGHLSVFPLYLYPDPERLGDGTMGSDWGNVGDAGRTPNLSASLVNDLSAQLGLTTLIEGHGDLFRTLGPEDVFDYIYAVFHSPTYRERYSEFLKIDFPRVPLTSDVALFRDLVALGGELVALHLMEHPDLPREAEAIGYPRAGSNEVETSHPTYFAPGELPPGEKQPLERGRVYTNGTRRKSDAAHAQYFEGIAPEVWEFQVGGYQVLDKWLKDRKGRTLTEDDIEHYKRVVVALSRTIDLMAQIDEVIAAHGGFPDAFAPAE